MDPDVAGHANEHAANSLPLPLADEPDPFAMVDGQTRVVDRTEIPEPLGRIDGLNQGNPDRAFAQAFDVSGGATLACRDGQVVPARC